MMKQSKRMLSVLLAIIMICSTFTIGASALKADVTQPAGYDEVLDPTVTSDQAARMLLDLVEPLLADMDVDEEVAGLTIKIQSIDTLLDTLHELNNSTLADIALGLLGGDLNDLNLKAGDQTDSRGNRCRRNNATSTEFEVLGAVLYFLEKNAQYVAKFAYDGLDFGLLDSLGVFGEDDLAALKDVHGLVTTLLEKLLAGEEFELDIEQEYHSSNTIDGLLQNFIDNKLVKILVDLFAEDGENTVAEMLGLSDVLAADGTLTTDVPTTRVFPSLTEGKLGKLDLFNDSFYDFLVKLFKGLINDAVIPYAGVLLGDLIDDEIAGYIDIALPILDLDVTFPEGAGAKEKIDILLNYLLVDEVGSKKFITFKESSFVNSAGQTVPVKYLSLADGFWTMLTDILKTVLPMLPPLLGDDCPDFDKTDAEIAELNDEQFITYIIQAVLEKFVDGVEFAEDCDTIRELASWTLVEVCKDLMPEKNFEEDFLEGRMDPNSDDCLKLGAYVIRYYLNGETTIQDNTPDSQMTLAAMLNTAADWALDKFGSVFGYDKTKYAGSSVWTKAYDTVFALIPLNLFVGAAPVAKGSQFIYKPGIPDSATGLQNLIMDDILGGVLEFNVIEGDVNEVGVTGLNKILSLIGRRGDSELNKPIPQILLDLVARLINPLFGLPTEKNATDQLSLIIPYTYTSLDQLVTANHDTSSLSLTNTLYRLCLNIGFINKGTNSLFYAGCPMITKLIGLWGDEDEDYSYPFIDRVAPTDFNGGRQYTYETLKALYEQYADSSNEGISYDDPAYQYFHMVDFQPFLYLDFKRARSDVASLLSDYEQGKATDMFRSDATNAAYRLLTIVRFMEEGYNYDKSVETDESNYEKFGETVANDNQLLKVYNKALNGGYTQEDYGDGTKKYTDRSWSAFQKALNFAAAVEQDYQQRASESSANVRAKLLRDMRQSKINMARKMLVKAMAALKSWVPLADYSSLDASIQQANDTISLRRYSAKAVKKVLAAYLDAIGTERDYDQDDQFIVDKAYEDLAEALENMDYDMVDYLDLWMDGFGQYIDEDNGYLFGLPEGFANAEEIEMNGDFNTYMGMFGAANSPAGDWIGLDIASTATGNGTGAVIKMCDCDEETGYFTVPREGSAEYTVIIFGDVDGDAYANACDSTVLRAYCQLKLTDSQFGAPAIFAADANDSGTIDNKDAKFVESAGIMKEFVNQAPESLIYKTYGILDVLDLREPA